MAVNADMRDFEPDLDSISSSSDGSSSDDDQEDVRPYMYEPLAEEIGPVIDELSIDPSLQNPGPRDVSKWCQCSNCRAMQKEEECVCCKQTPHINNKMVCEDDNISCIIAHPGFEPVCLNPYVLETAYYQYRHKYGEHEVHDDNERKRYTAYRQLVRWYWGYLGRDVRVVLSSCAVLAIRKAFPSDNYEGFHRV